MCLCDLDVGSVASIAVTVAPIRARDLWSHRAGDSIRTGGQCTGKLWVGYHEHIDTSITGEEKVRMVKKQRSCGRRTEEGEEPSRLGGRRNAWCAGDRQEDGLVLRYRDGRGQMSEWASE